MKYYTFRGKLIGVAIAKSWDGFDVGLFSCKRISNDKGKALRLVIWRLAVWVQYA